MFWFWFFVGPALVLAFLALRGERRRAEYFAERLNAAPKHTPPATVVVPVKGFDEGLRENLASLAALDYPDVELIVTAQTAADIPPDVLPSRVKVVLERTFDPSAPSLSSEKIHNLRNALRAARPRSQVYAFADSDGRVREGWLRALVAVLEQPNAGAATGYRWYTPQPPTFWSLIRSVWNAPIFGWFGPDRNRFAWGGAMAIYKDVFESARILHYWQNTVSDDFGLSRALRACGLSIAFAPGATVASSDHITAREFLAWIRRQMVLTRVYDPLLWWSGLVAQVFYCGAMAACVVAIAHGSRGAEWALVAQLGAGMLKGANRATLAKAALPEWSAWFDRHAWVHTLWTPLATWFWLYALIASACGSTIHWRGRRYRLSASRVRAL